MLLRRVIALLLVGGCPGAAPSAVAATQGECKPWCDDFHAELYAQKCTWAGCSGCSECEECLDWNVATGDALGDDCSWYEAVPDGCGSFDDHDFSSEMMCCACGGGTTPGCAGWCEYNTNPNKCDWAACQSCEYCTSQCPHGASFCGTSTEWNGEQCVPKHQSFVHIEYTPCFHSIEPGAVAPGSGFVVGITQGGSVALPGGSSASGVYVNEIALHEWSLEDDFCSDYDICYLYSIFNYCSLSDIEYCFGSVQDSLFGSGPDFTDVPEGVLFQFAVEEGDAFPPENAAGIFACAAPVTNGCYPMVFEYGDVPFEYISSGAVVEVGGYYMLTTSVQSSSCDPSDPSYDADRAQWYCFECDVPECDGAYFGYTALATPGTMTIVVSDAGVEAPYDGLFFDEDGAFYYVFEGEVSSGPGVFVAGLSAGTPISARFPVQVFCPDPDAASLWGELLN